MKTKTISFYSDPGHGWAKVKLSDLKKLNIQNKISTYSYMRKNDVFLEEDCDFAVYAEACRNIDIVFKYAEHTSNKSSKIRNYSSYTTAGIDWENCSVL